MEKNLNILKSRTGFSLAEVLAAMMIGSMVLISVLTVYNRAEHTAASVTRTLSDSRNPYEALQLIAEDLDKITANDGDTNFVIMNRYINDYAAALLVARVRYKDPTDKDQNFEELFWQCNSNYKGDANDMVLYRSMEGIAPEDKLLDKDKDNHERNAYVPICRGVTYFDIKVYTGKKDEPAKVFPGGVPLGIIVTISFARPFKNSDGHYDVPDNEKYSRTIAINKSRSIKFDITQTDSEETAKNAAKTGDPNTAADAKKTPSAGTSKKPAAGTQKTPPRGTIPNTGTRATRTGTTAR